MRSTSLAGELLPTVCVLASFAFVSAANAQSPVPANPRLPTVSNPVRTLVPQLRFETAPSGSVELGALTGGEVLVRASGGVGAITLTLETGRPNVVTLAAHANSGAQLAQAGGIVSRVSPANSVPRDVLTRDDKAAVPVERVVRLAPFANLSAIGGPIAVIVRATDSRGTQASAAFSIAPVAARISAISKPGGTVRDQAIALGVDVDLLPPGARIDITESVSAASIEPRPAVCAFTFRQASSGAAPSATAGANGSARITVPGRFFAYDHAKTGPCAVVLKGRLVRGGGADEPIEIRKMDISLSTPTPYVVQGTWGIRDRLAFDVRPGLPGACVGASVGGVPQPIGVHQVGADLAIGIRSGPLGTDCAAKSAAWTLPDGFRVAGIDWDVVTERDACCVGNACLPSGSSPDTTLVVPGAIPSENVDAYDGNAASDADKPPPRADGSRPPFLSRMHVRLGCKATPLNDHGVKVVLRSVSFEGPAGASFP